MNKQRAGDFCPKRRFAQPHNSLRNGCLALSESCLGEGVVEILKAKYGCSKGGKLSLS